MKSWAVFVPRRARVAVENDGFRERKNRFKQPQAALDSKVGGFSFENMPGRGELDQFVGQFRIDEPEFFRMDDENRQQDDRNRPQEKQVGRKISGGDER